MGILPDWANHGAVELRAVELRGHVRDGVPDRALLKGGRHL
ncbi:hypothetical protein AB0M87_30400 [Streptomyces sp. NPDC051320]